MQGRLGTVVKYHTGRGTLRTKSTGEDMSRAFNILPSTRFSVRDQACSRGSSSFRSSTSVLRMASANGFARPFLQHTVSVSWSARMK